MVNGECCSSFCVMITAPNVEVSDTTGDDSSNTVCHIKISTIKKLTTCYLRLTTPYGTNTVLKISSIIFSVVTFSASAS